MPIKGPVLRSGCLWALAWVLVLAGPPQLVQATSQDTTGSVGVALEPAPPPGFFRLIVQVRQPCVLLSTRLKCCHIACLFSRLTNQLEPLLHP